MQTIKRAFLKTPVGYLEIKGTDRGVCRIDFLEFRVKIWIIPRCLKEPMKQLKEYFNGTRKIFTFPLDMEGTEFQIKVWEELIKVPYGKTISYHELAERVGDPKMVRAVGQADAKNPIPVVIPCHRVIGADGKLVGYGGGLERKKWLLEHEQAFAQKDLFYS